MLRRLLPSFIALAALAAAAPASAVEGVAASGGATEYVPDEVIVKYEDGSTRRERADAQADSGTRFERKLPGGSRELDIVAEQGVGETVAELREEADVAYAVPNYVARVSQFLPNDPGFGAGWAEAQWNFSSPAGVNAPHAWELAAGAGAPGGLGAVVAVLDTGVAYTTRGRFRRAPYLRADGFVRGYDFVS
jgi:hypothetical protein